MTANSSSVRISWSMAWLKYGYDHQMIKTIHLNILLSETRPTNNLKRSLTFLIPNNLYCFLVYKAVFCSIHYSFSYRQLHPTKSRTWRPFALFTIYTFTELVLLSRTFLSICKVAGSNKRHPPVRQLPLKKNVTV